MRCDEANILFFCFFLPGGTVILAGTDDNKRHTLDWREQQTDDLDRDAAVDDFVS
jgi:hypothetical protein